MKHLKAPRQCDAHRAGRPLKAIYSDMKNYDPSISDKYRCKNPAYWEFKALKKSWVDDGIFCYSHLIHRGIYGDVLEEARTNKQLRRIKERECKTNTSSQA